jgi:hypothetical protein
MKTRHLEFELGLKQLCHAIIWSSKETYNSYLVIGSIFSIASEFSPILFSLGLSLSTAPSATFANKRNHFISNDVKNNSVMFHSEPVLTYLLCAHTQSYSLNGSFPPISNNENLDNDKISASIFHGFFLCHLRSE